MKVIDLYFRGSKFSIACDNAEKVLELAKSLSERGDKIAEMHPSGITDLRALFLVAITMADELDKVNSAATATAEETVDRDQVIASFDKVSQYVNNLSEIVDSALKS